MTTTTAAPTSKAWRYEREVLQEYGRRRCTRCREIKHLEDFTRNSSKADGITGTCKECHKARTAAQKSTLAGRESQRAANARYMKSAAGRVSTRRYNASEKGREVNRRGARRYYATDHGREAMARRKEARRERLKARSPEEVAAAREQRHPDGTKVCKVCRTPSAFSEFSIDRSQVDGLWKRCKSCDRDRTRRRLLSAALPIWEDLNLWSCVYCGAPWEHVDHVVPRADGGTDAPRNLVPACAACNLSKSATPVLEWLA